MIEYNIATRTCGGKGCQGQRLRESAGYCSDFEARLKKLRYGEKAKTLVPARDVADAAYRTVSCIKEACLNVPARVAAQLAMETDQNRCYAIVEAEIKAVFRDFAEGRIA